jgi:hypothetical protein
MRTRAWLAAALIAAGNLPAGAQALCTLGRPEDPVVMTGADVPQLEGFSPDEVVAFRYHSGWEQIPVQVDERAAIDWGSVYGLPAVGTTTLDYTDPNTYAGADPDPTLDSDDEIVLMARDAGDQAPPAAGEPPGVVPASGLEVEAGDPLSSGRGWVYLFANAGALSQDAGKDYVSYGFDLSAGSYIPNYNTASGPNPEDSTVTTAAYSAHFSDRWIRDAIRVSAGGASEADILDRHKALFGPGICSRSEETFSTGEGAFFANKDGAVRAIRSYLGANSGPTTHRLHLFYEGREDIRTALRVHPIDGIMDFFDYSPAAAGMVYRNDRNPAGVTIDGMPDAVTPDPDTWEMVTGPQGTLVISLAIDTDIPGFAYVAYYSDDSTPSTTQCTGDPFEYGASGIWVNQAIPNTDPGLPLIEHYRFEPNRIIYYLAPDQSVPEAERLSLQAKNPVQVVSVTPWSGSASCDAARIRPIAALAAVKAGADVLLSWSGDPQADGYNVWTVGEASAIPQAREGGSGAPVSGCGAAGDTTCTDTGAVDPGSGARRFYQVRGTCLGNEAAE